MKKIVLLMGFVFILTDFLTTISLGHFGLKEGNQWILGDFVRSGNWLMVIVYYLVFMLVIGIIYYSIKKCMGYFEESCFYKDALEGMGYGFIILVSSPFFYAGIYNLINIWSVII